MMKVIFRPRAQSDIDSIAIYIGIVQANPRAASKLVDTLLDKINLLSQPPKLGKPCETIGTNQHDYRVLVIENYRVFYRVANEQVIICRVIHARRDIDDYDILDI